MPEEKSLLRKIKEVVSLVLTLVLAVSLGVFVTFRFFGKGSSLQENDLWLVVIVSVLVLSGTFSSISIGNFLSLKKDVKETKAASERISNNFGNLFTEIFSNALEIRTIYLSELNSNRNPILKKNRRFSKIRVTKSALQFYYLH